MKNALNKVFIVVAICLFITPVLAENSELETARKNISKQFEGVNPKNITKSPVPGLYQVFMPPRFFYASADGRYIIDGDLVDAKTKQSISQVPRDKSVAAAINAMGEDSMIIFGKDTLKHTVTVFTDIDCGYCRKLHSEMDKYMAEGITIQYLFYPRAGKGSDSYKKAVSVWCADDRNAALTKAKNGAATESKTCDNPIDEHMQLGIDFEARGTPMIITEKGNILPGYVPADRLAKALARE
ncbi:MAG: DsbC family protein [Gammaproteobacteria bacterium]|nr:DsbC family protein [Gammaproteobacteria bacterium]